MNQLNIFYNTNRESGEVLKRSTVKAGSQNKEILKRLKHLSRSLTVAQIHYDFENTFKTKVPRSSIVRAVSDLKKLGFITEVLNPDGSAKMTMGEYGKMVHLYELR